MSKPKKTNQLLINLITDLKKQAFENKAPIWKDIARRLEKPNRSWATVNLGKMAAYTKKGDMVVVPGKLLGVGEINFPVTVAAFSFSESAQKKIKSAGGAGITIPELVKKNPKGKGVRIIG